MDTVNTIKRGKMSKIEGEEVDISSTQSVIGNQCTVDYSKVIGIDARAHCGMSGGPWMCWIGTEQRAFANGCQSAVDDKCGVSISPKFTFELLQKVKLKKSTQVYPQSNQSDSESSVSTQPDQSVSESSMYAEQPIPHELSGLQSIIHEQSNLQTPKQKQSDLESTKHEQSDLEPIKDEQSDLETIKQD